MAKTYTVWIEVEEHDDETDHYENLDLLFGGSAGFTTEEAAVEFASKLDDVAREMRANQGSEDVPC